MTYYFYHISGKRLCPGETFGRQNMWLILAALLQNFTLTVPKGQKPPALRTVPGFHQTAPEVWFQPLPRTWTMAVTKHWCQNIHVPFVTEDCSRGTQICHKFKKCCHTKLIPLDNSALGFVPSWIMIWILKSLLKFVHVEKTINMILEGAVW